MQRALSIATLAALAVAAAGSLRGQTREQTAPVFGQELELVSVDVLVLDSRGNPVPGLRREDFTVSENGKPQDIASFESVSFEETPPGAAALTFVSTNVGAAVRADRSFVVIVDDVHLTQSGALRARAEITKLIDGLEPGDEVTLVPTSEGRWWSGRLPAGRDDLVAFLERLQPKDVPDLSSGRLSDWEAMQIHYGRDPSVLSVVARRWYENGLLVEFTPPRGDRGADQDRDISPGLPLIRAKASQVYQQMGERMARSMAVIERAVASLSLARGRKAVLVVSEGFAHDVTRPEFRELVRTARQANAVLYFFDAKGQAGPFVPGNDAEFGNAIEERDRTTIVQQFSHDAEGTESIALDTGGLAFKGTDDLAGPMRRVVDESRSYYLLGYAPPAGRRDGKFRSIKVEVARPGAVVRARKGYYAPDDREAKKKDTSPDAALDPRVRNGLVSPFVADAIPLRLASYVLGPDGPGPASVLLAAELDVRSVAFAEQGGRRQAALETYLIVTPRDGGESRRQEKRLDLSLPAEVHARLLREGLPLLRDVDLPPGAYQARLLVRDPKGGAMGTVRHDFRVPAADGLRLSTPILTDSVAGEGAEQRPVPIAHRAFKAGTRLVYAFEAYGATADGQGRSGLSVAYSVRRADGAVVAQVPERLLVPSSEGTLSQRIEIPLVGVAPGAYEIVLAVEDAASRRRLERRDPFVVE